MEPVGTRETRSARIELHPSGCIMVRCRRGITQTVDDARENVTASVDLADGKPKRPILVDIRKVEPLSSEVRHFYVGGALADNFGALGLVIEASPLGRMMGNVFFRMMDTMYRSKRGIPTRLFSDDETAIAWLTSVTR